MKRYQEALRDFDKAIELKPDYTLAYNNRGVTYFKMKRYDEALRDFERSLALDPNNAQFSTNRADTCRKLRIKC